MMTSMEFKRRFLTLILLTWMVPPIVGLGFIVYLRILTPGQVFTILTTPLEPLYIFIWLVFTAWYFPRSMRPVSRWLTETTPQLEADALMAMRRFPLGFWLLFLTYLLFAPASVIVAAERYTDFIAQPVDWFRIQLVALIVSIVVGLPIFFRILDLFGQALGSIRLVVPHVTLKAKVFLIGALVPLLIDTMLVQYFWTRTGYFTHETFFVWLALEMLAIAGSLIFVRSIGQSLSPLQSVIGRESAELEHAYAALQPKSTDELGVLTTAYRQLLGDISVHNEMLVLNNQLLRNVGEASELPGFLDSVVALCMQAIHCDKAFILLPDEAQAVLVCVVQSDAPYTADGYFKLPMDEQSLPALVYRKGYTLAIDDLENDVRRDPDTCEMLRARAVLVAPLRVDDRVIGVLMGMHCQRQHHYTRREVALAENLAREAALALNTAELKLLRQQAEEERALQDERYRRLVESSTAIPWELDLNNWRFSYVGNQAERVLGYPLEDWYRENFWRDHIYSDDMQAILDECKSAVDRGADHELEYRMLAADGRKVWIRNDVKIVCGDDGRPLRLHGFMFDITQRKQAEVNLSKSESGLAEAQRIASLGSWELDIADDTLHWSNEIYCIFELDPTEFTPSYEAFLNAVHPDDREMVNTAYTHSLQTTQPYDLEHRLLMSDGRVKYVHQYCETQYNRAGEPLRSIGTVQDVTERVHTEQELEQHREQLEQLVDARTEELSAVNRELEAFNYSVSHDLRAPIRAIDGFSEALEEDFSSGLEGEGLEYVARIRSNSRRMRSLIDDLLKLSRLGRMEMKLESVDLARLGEQVMGEIRAADPGRKLEFKVETGKEVEGDPSFLRIVLENLFGNAWKYTRNREHAEIILGETLRDNENVYYVRDNGAGFDMQHADRLFTAFQRLHQDDEFEGSGIGLATVARIIHRHGGEVWAESVSGQGATFYFSLGTCCG